MAGLSRLAKLSAFFRAPTHTVQNLNAFKTKKSESIFSLQNATYNIAINQMLINENIISSQNQSTAGGNRTAIPDLETKLHIMSFGRGWYASPKVKAVRLRSNPPWGRWQLGCAALQRWAPILLNFNKTTSSLILGSRNTSPQSRSGRGRKPGPRSQKHQRGRVPCFIRGHRYLIHASTQAFKYDSTFHSIAGPLTVHLLVHCHYFPRSYQFKSHN